MSVTETDVVRAALDLQADNLTYLGKISEASEVRARIPVDRQRESGQLVGSGSVASESVPHRAENLADLSLVGERPDPITYTDPREVQSVSPRSLGDMELVAEFVRHGRPLILKVALVGEGEASRMLDFASGLAAAVSGKITPLGQKRYLIDPHDVESSPPTTVVAETPAGAFATPVFSDGTSVRARSSGSDD